MTYREIKEIKSVIDYMEGELQRATWEHRTNDADQLRREIAWAEEKLRDS
jgi:hypothetical protein